MRPTIPSGALVAGRVDPVVLVRSNDALVGPDPEEATGNRRGFGPSRSSSSRHARADAAVVEPWRKLRRHEDLRPALSFTVLAYFS